MPESIVLDDTKYLNSLRLSYSLAGGAKLFEKTSGGSGYNALLTSKALITSPFSDQSARQVIAATNKRLRFGFASLDKRFAGTNFQLGWELIPATSETVVFSDNFSTDHGTPDYDTAKWDVLGSPTSIVVSGGELTITQSSTGGLKSDSAFDLVGKAVQVKVPVVESNGNITNGFLLANDDTLSSYIGFDEYNGNLRFASAGSGNSVSIASITYNATNHAYLRVRFASSGNTIYFETSPDGTVWTERATGTYTQSKTALKLYLRNYVIAAGKVSKFADIKISSPPVSAKYQVIENGSVVFTSARAVSANNELRIQIIETSGTLQAKYYWRAESASGEELEHTSAKSDADLRSYFPLLWKGEIYDEGGIIKNAQIEGDGDIIESQFSALLQKPQNALLSLLFVGEENGTGGKELPNHQLIYSGPNLTTARNGIMTFKAMKDWALITGVRLSVFEPNSTQTTEFNIRKNNVNLFETNLTIPANQKQVDLEDLEIAVTETDEFIVDYKSVSKIVKSPIILELTIEAAQ